MAAGPLPDYHPVEFYWTLQNTWGRRIYGPVILHKELVNEINAALKEAKMHRKWIMANAFGQTVSSDSIVMPVIKSKNEKDDQAIQLSNEIILVDQI